MSSCSTNKQKKKNIVILGSSYAGLSIAHYILKHILHVLPTKDSSSYQVLLISRSSQVICRPACPRALLSDDMFPQEKLFVDVATQLQQYPLSNWQFVNGDVMSVNHEERSVTVKMSTVKDEVEVVEFYALVIATGASTPSPLLGLNSDVTALREAWTTIRTALPTAKSIVIAGGGPTGVEVAGELGECLNGRAGWFSTGRSSPNIAITLVTSSANILPGLRSSIARTAEQYLADVGVTIIKNTKVVSVSPAEAGLQITSLIEPATVLLSDGSELDADLYIPATGAKPNSSFLSDALLTSTHHVKTNSQTLRVDAAGPFVYAIGDVSSFASPAIHSILAAVPILGSNIKRDLLLKAGVTSNGVPPERQFEADTRETQLVPIGKSKGVGVAMGWRLPSWMVWLIKGRDYWLWTTGRLWNGRQWNKVK